MASSVASYLQSNADRVVLHVTDEYEPVLQFGNLLPDAAEAMRQKYDAQNLPHWQAAHNHILLRAPKDRFLFLLTHNRISAQCLGLYYWTQNRKPLTEAIRIGLEAME